MPPAKTAATSMETTLATIVAHPTRVRAFSILAERTASPVEIAQEIGKDVGHVGYHVRKLQELNLIELVDERPVRGAVEHFYRAIARPYVGEDEFGEQPQDEREIFTRHILQLHVTDIARAMDEHILDERSNRWLVRTADGGRRGGLRRTRRACTPRSTRRRWISRRAATNGVRGTDDEGIQTMSTNMFFEMPARRKPASEQS